MLDHGKSAIVDEIQNNGLPLHNPFYQASGDTNLLVYYYLWYFIAAVAGSLTGASGWEADVAFTYVTALMSILTMGWASVAYSQKRAASWWVLAISLTCSLRGIILDTFGPLLDDQFVREIHLESWVIQASWVPQHLFSANLVLLVVITMMSLRSENRRNIIVSGLAGVLAAAAYGSSVYAGGLGLLFILATFYLLSAKDIVAEKQIRSSATNAFIFGTCAMLLSLPFLIQQAGLAVSRPAIAVRVFPVFTDKIGTLAAIANIIHYWTVLAPIDLNFQFIVAFLWIFFWRFRKELFPKNVTLAFIALIVPPLFATEFLRSVLCNNDLGWRILLPAILAMTIVSSICAATLMSGPLNRRKLVIIALLAFVLVQGCRAGVSFIFSRWILIPTFTAKPHLKCGHSSRCRSSGMPFRK